MPTFSTVKQLVTGAGCFEQLGQLARGLGRRALVVTGKHAMKEAGVTDRACNLLKAAGAEHVLFEQIGGEPTAAQVDAGRKMCAETECDMVVGIGGGSAMDAAKAIAALVRSDAPTAEYVQGRKADADRVLPCICAPTTSGTGAEVTPNAVISHPASTVKVSVRGRGVLPTAALVDPDLTITCPPGVTAASGMDALTHAIEAYVSIHATPVTDALSFHAARLLLRNLPAAYADGHDRAAREACSYASTLAGIALANARLGVIHGIAHPLGIRYHVPHGVCCGVLLPASIRLNHAAAVEKYRWLSHVAGDDIEKAVERMLDAMNVGRTLREYNIPERDFAAITKESMPSGSLKANPKKVTEEDVFQILRQVAG